MLTLIRLQLQGVGTVLPPEAAHCVVHIGTHPRGIFDVHVHSVLPWLYWV